MDQKQIATWIDAGELPESEQFYGCFLRDDKLFNDAEGLLWDFKEVWPFSLSDDYFGGIARLICAFANSHGGIIIFGVHDEKRTGGHNKVKINFDRFCKALEQLLGLMPPIKLHAYLNNEAGHVDALLVQRRPDGTAPYRFQRQIGAYRAGQIWCRVGHEVRAAEPAQYPVLFCRAQLSDAGELRSLEGSLPPSPATLKQRFVGRTAVLDRLFHWLEASDEPRTYLHGKGGSGKTTIAYEFARLLRENGEALKVFGGDSLDAVIFVTAKEKLLNVADAKIIDAEITDFSNEEELLRSILYYGGWTRDNDYLQTSSLDRLRADVADFLDLNSVLIVVDDIDTLTTKGIDPGSDFLYRTLCRAKRQSKVVYTLRNAPSQSLMNAIEVPGLDDVDYKQFVKECVEHFQVPPPTEEFRIQRLSEVSERRPLVVESIIALRRTSGNYNQAVELFQQQVGDAIRDYVFLREWDALKSNTPRLLLAALSLFAESTSFGDLQSVLQFEASVISDAIGAVREMFLQIDEAGSDALYSLAPLTRAFVQSKRSQLVGYGLLHQRVKSFQRHVAVSNPRVANIATQVERLLPPRNSSHSIERLADATRIVTDKSLPLFVTEDPLFRTIVGYVLSCDPQPNLSSVRAAFQFALDMKSEPEYRYLRAWFAAEKNSGIHDGWCLRIADIVLNGKRYEEREKMEMIGRKATSLYARAQERLYTDSSDALKDLSEALRLHLRAYRLYCSAGDIRAENSQRYARNTAFQLFNMLARSAVPWEFIELLDGFARSHDCYLDPLEDPLAEAVDFVLKNALKIEGISRVRQRLKSVREAIPAEKIWLSNSACERVRKILQQFDLNLDERQRTLRQVNLSKSHTA